MFCLRPEFVDKLKAAFRKGELSPEKLNIDSQKRRELLSKYVGAENAKEMGLMFEKKLLLKNQEKAMYDFGRDIFGTNKAAKEAFNEKVRQAHADKNRRLFEPKENEAFLNEITSDIYSKKYGTEISLEQAQTITELSADVQEARDKITDLTQKTKESQDFGAKKVALDNYVGDLKREIQKESLVNPLGEKGLQNKLGALVKNARISFNFIADNSRALLSSLDNSFFGRQGLKALVNPQTSKLWFDSFKKSFSDIVKTIGGGSKAGDAILDSVKADIYSRPNYLNGRYELGKKLDIGTGEEAYPTSLPSKIPIFGRFFKASEVAYEAGAMRLRADIADKIYDMAEKAGVDLTNKKEVGDINEVINSMTGRGRLPLGEKGAKFINKTFFSIKFLKSNIDTLTLHQGKLSTFATKQAAINILSAVSVIGTVLAIAKSLDPDSTDFDPRSSLFGKIKIGHVPIDITGGLSGLVILVARILTQETKNQKTGVITKLGEGYGTPTGTDILFNFAENKLSPIAAVLRDIIRQKDFKGNKPTVIKEATSLVTPIPLSTMVQLKDEDVAVKIAAVLLDQIGFGTNANKFEQDWGDDTGKEIVAFRQSVGEEKFKEANNKFNERFTERLDEIVKNKQYKDLSNEEKKKFITKEKIDIKKDIFDEYQFHYRKQRIKKLPNI